MQTSFSLQSLYFGISYLCNPAVSLAVKSKLLVCQLQSTDKTKVNCVYCRCELSYHCSTSSMKYHFMANHTANASSLLPCLLAFCFQQRNLDTVKKDLLMRVLKKQCITIESMSLSHLSDIVNFPIVGQ